jgi:hypothetical protein
MDEASTLSLKIYQTRFNLTKKFRGKDMGFVPFGEFLIDVSREGSIN